MNINSSGRYERMSKPHEFTFESKFETDQELISSLVLDSNMKPTIESQRLKSFKVKSNLWIVTALLAGLVFAFSNLFVGKRSYNGFLTRELVILGNLFTGVFFSLIRLIYQFHYYGYFYKWEES